MRPWPLASLLAAAAAAVAACQQGPAPEGGADLAAIAPPYTLTPLSAARISSRAGAPDFQRAEAPIDLRDGPFASARLVVDLATTCFPFEGWRDNPPPMGQRWPADCDAFDRNFEVSLDEPQGAADPPALELLRAITPFGGPMRIEQDITDVANGRPGAHRLHVRIPTWSDGAGMITGSNGGWTVSARIEVTPGPAPRRVLAVVPIWNGSQGPEGASGEAALAVPPGTTHARLEYRVTGHGGGAQEAGCIGPAEEFCRRTHRIFVDDEQLDDAFVPWRSDCAKGCTVARFDNGAGGFDYCQQNPCGAIASVRAPRANWCPGSVTPPIEFTDAPALRAAGAHRLRFAISRIAAGGSIRLSATYLAFGE